MANRKYKRGEIVRRLARLSWRTGHWPRFKEVQKEKDVPRYSTVHSRLGGLAAARQEYLKSAPTLIEDAFCEFVFAEERWPTRSDLQSTPDLPPPLEVDRHFDKGLLGAYVRVTVRLDVNPPPIEAVDTDAVWLVDWAGGGRAAAWEHFVGQTRDDDP
jgi:hypothetical protein